VRYDRWPAFAGEFGHIFWAETAPIDFRKVELLNLAGCRLLPRRSSSRTT
jgi:hypothetical protein